MKVSDVVKWIIHNRRGKAFQDWPVTQIVMEVDKCISSGTMAYTTEHGRLTGLALAQKDTDNNTIEIFAVLTIDKEALPKLAHFFKTHCQGYKIITHSRVTGEKQLHEQTDKFINRLIRNQ